MTTVCHARLYGTFIEIKKQLRERETSYYELKFYFFGGSLSNRDNVRALIQFRRERSGLRIFKNNFSSKDPRIFTSTASKLFGY